jgi:hypothetical protein
MVGHHCIGHLVYTARGYAAHDVGGKCIESTATADSVRGGSSISAALERATAGAQKKVSDTVARQGRGHQCRAAAGAGSKLLRGRRRRCTLVAAIDQGSSAAGKRWRGQAEERYGGKDGELHDLPPLSG